MISYQPLFETMSSKGITSYTLFKKGFPKATYYSIRKGNSVSTNTINQLCKILECSVSDIMEYVEDEEQPYMYGFSYMFNIRAYAYNCYMRCTYDQL